MNDRLKSIEQARRTFDVLASWRGGPCPICARGKIPTLHVVCQRCWACLPWPIRSDLQSRVAEMRYRAAVDDTADFLQSFWLAVEWFVRCGPASKPCKARHPNAAAPGVIICLQPPRPEPARCCGVWLRDVDEVDAGFAVCGACAEIWAIDEEGRATRATAGQRQAALNMPDVQRDFIAARNREEVAWA